MDNHFVPLLGEMKLSSVLPVHVRRVVNALQSRGLSSTSVKNYVHILGSSFQCAIDAGLIRDNPVEGAKLPRVTPTKITIVDREDIPAYIDAVQKTRYPNELLLILYTGLRVGELRGLRWEDCDLDAGIMRVERQLHPNDRNIKRFTPPKYGEVRTVHLAEEAVAVLKNQKKRQLEQRLAFGGWADNEITRDLVFRQPNGAAHSGRTLYRAVQVVGAAIGKPDLHPHDLRHSYAVAALRSGMDVKTVQHNLGHKNAQMTLDVYAAYTEDAGKKGAEKMSSYLKQAKKEPV